MKNVSFLALAIAFALSLSACVSNDSVHTSDSVSTLKPAKIVPQSTNYFGTILEDPYQWMEKRENAAEVKNWMLEQATLIDRLSNADPMRDKIYQQLLELDKTSESDYFVRRTEKYTFFMASDADTQIPVLMVRPVGGEERVLIDAAEFKSGTGQQIAIDNYSPSPNGEIVAFNLSTGGGELTDILFINVASGELLDDKLTWVWGEFQASWLPDSSGVFYTRMTRESMKDDSVNKMHNMQVYLHRLGQSMDLDIPILGSEVDTGISFQPQEFPMVFSPKESRWLVGLGLGARAEMRAFFATKESVLEGAADWKELFDYSDNMNGWTLIGDLFYYSTTNDAPNGTVLSVSLDNTANENHALIVPEPSGVMTGFVVKGDWVYYAMDHNGRSKLYKKKVNGDELVEVPLPFVGQLAIFEDSQQDSAFHVSLEGWTQPRTYFEYLPESGEVRSIGLGAKSDVDMSDVVVENLEAVSHDGVMVPVTVLRPKNMPMDGKNPTIVAGYGGYGYTIKPRLSATYKPWFDIGGVVAYAHVRGSGVKGKQWHLAGKGVNKKNGVQDFIAVTEHLIASGYTSRKTVAASGGSMGGVLIGRAITEAPELFAASSIYVGMLNTVRYLESDNGANQTSELTATPDSKEGFEILLAMDSYHNIRRGIDYPSTMLVVGLNDQRVPPWESAKFAAKMQALASNKTKVFLRAKDSEGHGIGSTKEQRLLSSADVWSFYLREFSN